MSDLPKKRMVGIAILSIFMFILGAVTTQISRETGGFGATSIPQLIWIPVCWHAIIGNVSSIVSWARFAIFFQIFGLIIAIFTSGYLMGDNALINNDLAIFFIISGGLPLIIWFLVYNRVKSVEREITPSKQTNFSSSIPLINKKENEKKEMASHLTNVVNHTESNDKSLSNKQISQNPELENVQNNSDKLEDIEINTKKHKKAMMIIEYNDEINSYWRKIKEGQLSLELQTKFLNALEKNPKLNVEALYTKLISQEKELRRPFEEKEANDAYEFALQINPSAAEEFKNVYENLGDSITVTQILAKIRKKYFEGFFVTPYEIKQMRSLVLTNELGDFFKVLSEIGYSIEKDSGWAGSFTRPFDGKEIKYAYQMGSTDLRDLFLNEINLIEQHNQFFKNSEEKKKIDTEKDKYTDSTPLSDFDDDSSLTEKEIKYNNLSKDIEYYENQYANAMIAIEYDEETEKYWSKIKDSELLLKQKVKFLSSLEKNPNINVFNLYKRLKAEDRKIKRPFKDHAANDAYEECLKHGEKVADEFKKVYDVMNKTLPIEQILNKVKKKFKISKIPFENHSIHKSIKEKNQEEMENFLMDYGYKVWKYSLTSGRFKRPSSIKEGQFIPSTETYFNATNNLSSDKDLSSYMDKELNWIEDNLLTDKK